MSDCGTCGEIRAKPMSDVGRQIYHVETKILNEEFRNSVNTFSVYCKFPGKSGGHAKLILVHEKASGVKEGYTVELVFVHQNDPNGEDSLPEIRPRTEHLSPFKSEGRQRIIHVPGIKIVAKLQEILVLAELIMGDFGSYNKCSQ